MLEGHKGLLVHLYVRMSIFVYVYGGMYIYIYVCVCTYIINHDILSRIRLQLPCVYAKTS